MPEEKSDARPHSSANWLHFLYAGLILLGCVAFYQAAQTENLLGKIAEDEKTNATLKTSLARSEVEFRDSLSKFHADLASMQIELSSARRQADSSLATAQAATKYTDTLAGKLERKRRDQEKQQQRLTAELNNVQQSTDEASKRLNGISAEVGGVKETLASVQADATQNAAGLEHTSGDVDELKDGVATNSEQIQMLRDRGEKNIVEFSLTKDGGMRRVGDIQMKLDKTDEKHNTFTVEISADDKRIAKRDKTINEPVDFFVSKRPGQAYELVINEVGKSSVKGYLAAPKEKIDR